MQLRPELTQPLQSPSAQPSRSKGFSLPEIHLGSAKQLGLRVALGLLVVSAGTGLRPSPSQAAGGELYEGPGQATSADINPCGPETKVLELCFDNRPNEDGSVKTPGQQGVFRRFLRAGHPEDIETPFFRAICPDGAFPGTEDPQTCMDQVAQVPVPRATMADLADPERATKFASQLAAPAEEPAASTPSPEPVAAPPAETEPIQSAPADCPPFGAPLGGSGILTNPRIARDNMIDWAKRSPLENITDVPKNSGRVHRFVDFNMNPGGKFNVSSFKCLGGTWRFAGTSETHTTGNRTGSWSFPFIIRDPEVARGTWTAVWQADDPNTPEVDFKVVLQQNFRIVD